MAANNLYRTHLLAARCAAVASIGAATIHLGVTPAHWRDWQPSGVFFATVAVFQLVWGFIAWSKPAPLVLLTGILANAGVATLWVVARTEGAPFGPHAGQPEAVDAAGICALLLECYVVMGALWAWSRRNGAEYVSGFGSGLILLGANTIMAGAVMMGLASSLQGQGHHHGAGAADHAAPPQPAARTVPSPGPSLPVVDMGLETGGHSDHVDHDDHHGHG